MDLMDQLIDTHCHLTNGRLISRVDEVIDRANAEGVGPMICASATIRESQASLALAHRRDGIFVTAGVHPHDAAGVDEDYLETVEGLCGDEKNVALGEIGLDYHYDYSPRDDQKRIFAEQLALAKKLGKITVIHTREAFDDTLDILKQSRIDGSRVIFHSFTGGPGDVTRALDFGATISFSGIATFPSAKDIHQSVALVPGDRMLVETDSPFLSPEPVRKIRTNEPANVVHVSAFLAKIKKMTQSEMAMLTTGNAKRIFEI